MSASQSKVKSFTQKYTRVLPLIVIGLILAFLPLGIPTFARSLLIQILIYTIFAMSYDMLLGYMGLVSFGHSAFWGTGAYVVGIVSREHITTSFWLTLLICIAAGIVFSLIFGFLSMRTSGIYFAFVNLAFSQALFSLSFKWRALTGGEDGISGIARPWDLKGMGFYYFIFAFFMICFLLIRWITSARYGHILIGIRENEQRMKAIGYNTWAYKYSGYVVASIFGTIAGFLFAYYNKFVSPEDFAFTITGMALLMVLIGGKANQWGCLIGSAIIVLLYQMISTYTKHWLLVVGIIFVIVVLFARQGLLGYVSQLWKKVRYGSIKN